jgi:serine/threonine protein phosphatase PrpC
MVAQYTARHVAQKLLDTKHLTPGLAEAEVPAKSKAAFEKALMDIDAELRKLPEVESGQDQSGSTSVMTLFSPQFVVCANTGDSRAVLCRGGEAVALSHDHKPYNPGEKERIEAAGSHVKFNRVNGDLAVSRALGDFVYKRCETVTEAEQAVTAFPDVIVEQRTERDEFVVLACDGIWDVMSSQEVCDKVREMLINGRPPPPPADSTAEGEEDQHLAGRPPLPQSPHRPWDLGAVAECLIDHCLRLGSRDNMSVIVVLLDPKLAPKPENEPAPMQTEPIEAS